MPACSTVSAALNTLDAEQRRKETAELRRQLGRVATELEALEPLAQPDGPAGRRPPVNPRRNVERFEPVKAKFVRFTILATNSGEPCLDELEVFSAGPEPRNVALAAGGTKATASSTLPGHAIHQLAHINDGQYGNGRSWIANEAGRGWVQLELKEPVLVDRIVWGRDREGKFTDRLPIQYRIAVASEPGAWKVVASSDDRARGGVWKPQPSALKAEDRAVFATLSEQRNALERRLAALARPEVAYAGTFTVPPATHRLHRGEPLQKREVIAPAALASFGAKLVLPMNTPERERRLALAKWITDPRYPLTARVLVNRLWHYHFGTGLVATPSDFGHNGARPSHPELLDFLADEFVQSGWSQKHMHRLIVLSATYRQASASNPKALAADAGSRLLWRYPPHRLVAEALRDAVLAVSGNLDPRMGGPGFDLFEPNTNYVKVYTPKKEFGPPEWRRMVYQNKPRMQLDDVFGSFDCPDAGQIAPRRTSSTTALQALNLLNSRFIVQQAGIFAARLQREAGDDVAARCAAVSGWRISARRRTTNWRRQRSWCAAYGLAAFCRAMLNANEFLYVF